ncbi:MAG: SDR family oxidoreductase [Candidatus Thermoplasmatota archaeon]|nr:SDR family oxidoreductase [Candidatus Thermoplasmatota archaeon]
MTVALVTGASRGIGRAIAIRLARDGFHVAINYRSRRSSAERTLSEVIRAGMNGVVVQADVSKENEVLLMFAQAESELGVPLVLVNNAGIYPRKPFDELTKRDWNRVIHTNLDSMYNCCKYAVPNMREEGWGRIVNVSSMLGFSGSTQGAHYGASKAGVIGFTKSLALEVARHGIRVNAVAPGATLTAILRGYTEEQKMEKFGGIPAGRLGRPEDIAGAVSFLCSEDADYIVGETIHVNGGYLTV